MLDIRLTEGTARDIDKPVAKILRGLGKPDPPLNLDAVFELLKLDRQYYTTSEDGVVRETISRVNVGAKIFLCDSMRIWDAIKKLDLQAILNYPSRVDFAINVLKCCAN